MKKNALAIFFLITTIVAVVYGYSQKQKADEWEKKAYIMGQEAAEYKVALEKKEKEAVELMVMSEIARKRSESLSDAPKKTTKKK